MRLFKEVLGEEGWRALAALAGSPVAEEYYLAGGTGLALQLGHRKSFDLDFFTLTPAEELSISRIELVMRRMLPGGGHGQPRLVQRAPDQTTWDIFGTRVTFIAYPFPLLEPCSGGDAAAVPEIGAIALATAREIALMKAYTIGRRAAFRDYVDMYFVLKSGAATLEHILQHAPGKFTLHGEALFSARLFLEQLVYTKDVPDREQALNLVLNEVLSVEDVEAFLRDEARRIVRSVEVRAWRRKW